MENLTGMVGVVALSGLVAALMQALKLVLAKLPGGDIDAWKPLLAIALGVGVTLLFEPSLGLRETLAQGLLVGLSASGFYSSLKSAVKK